MYHRLVEGPTDIGGHQRRGEVRQDQRADASVCMLFERKPRRERIWDANVARERAQHHLQELDAVWRNRVGNRMMIGREEVGEVVQKHKQNPKRASVERPGRIVQFAVDEKRPEESEQVQEKPMESRPSLPRLHQNLVAEDFE